jgi:hypothetical protein
VIEILLADGVQEDDDDLAEADEVVVEVALVEGEQEIKS